MANVKTVARKTLGWVSRLISIAALIAVLILSGMLLRSIAQTKKTQELTSSLQAIRTTAQETNETDWSNGMLAVNPDYKGWLTVYGTTATGPVVQGETNDTYLRTDIYGEHSIPGTLFLDEVCDTRQHGNLIIYGHTANNSGTTEISITSQNKRLTAGAVVNVVEPLQGFQAEDIVASTKSTLVPVTYTTVPEGADAGTVTISVADSEIARVDENNNIIPLKAGDTTVTIRSDKGPSSIVNLKVTQAPTELFADDLYVEIGETAKLNVYTDVKDLESGVDGTNYTYENESNLICAVSVEGDVTGIETGDSVVKIQNEYGLETQATVHVTPKTSHITFGFSGN